MSNARIQFSTADESTWNAYNPRLREGELVISKNTLGKFTLRVGALGGSNYKDSTVVWDEVTAQKLITKAENCCKQC